MPRPPTRCAGRTGWSAGCSAALMLIPDVVPSGSPSARLDAGATLPYSARLLARSRDRSRSREDSMTFPQLLKFARRWLWLILLGMLLASVASYVVSSRSPRVYEGTAKLLVAAGPGTGRGGG